MIQREKDGRKKGAGSGKSTTTTLLEAAAATVLSVVVRRRRILATYLSSWWTPVLPDVPTLSGLCFLFLNKRKISKGIEKKDLTASRQNYVASTKTDTRHRRRRWPSSSTIKGVEVGCRHDETKCAESSWRSRGSPGWIITSRLMAFTQCAPVHY